MYAIKKGSFYVSKPGSQNSYTNNPANARKYDTLEQAQRDCCGNEHIVTLSGGYTEIFVQKSPIKGNMKE
jgi:hypothetical protein